jgi:hypothetical protein
VSSTQISFHKTAYVSIVRKCTCQKERKLFSATRKKTLVSANVGAYFLPFEQHFSPLLITAARAQRSSFHALSHSQTLTVPALFGLDTQFRGPGQLSRYTDSLRPRRSGDRIPVGGEIFSTRPDRPWRPPSVLYNAYWVSFPGVQRPRHGADHPTPFSAEGKERVEVYISSPSEPSWPVQG